MVHREAALLVIVSTVELCGHFERPVVDHSHGFQVALLLLPLSEQVPEPVRVPVHPRGFQRLFQHAAENSRGSNVSFVIFSISFSFSFSMI